jgi:hypothetical protein
MMIRSRRLVQFFSTFRSLWLQQRQRLIRTLELIGTELIDQRNFRRIFSLPLLLKVLAICKE